MSKTLLLADDSVVIQKLVGLSFANEDIEIIATDNGDDAIERAREIVPDVVLADVVMPGKSGYDVCEAIKQDPALAHIPVLLLTGTFEAFDEARAASVGATGQITKPFEAQALVERVSEVMNAPAPVSAASGSAPVVDDFFDTEVKAPPTVLESTSTSTSAAAATAGSPNRRAAVSSLDSASLDQTPAIDVLGDDRSEEVLFGAPGEAEIDVLDTNGGSLSLGQSVEPFDATETTEATDPVDSIGSIGSVGAHEAGEENQDLTIVSLPERPVIGEPSVDPLASFSDDLGAHDPFSVSPPPIPTAAETVDLDSALDAAPSDDDATILVATDDVNATTSPNMARYDDLDILGDEEDLSDELDSPDLDTPDLDVPAGSDLDDLTVHSPMAAIDQAYATAASPVDAGRKAMPSSPAATRVADLDKKLDKKLDKQGADDLAARLAGVVGGADSSPSITGTPAPETAPKTARASSLELGPTNVSPESIDYAFDVSEQAPADRTDDPMADSFSSLMDISESQILGGPPRDPSPDPRRRSEDSDALAAGYDVSTSDLATAPPPIPEPIGAPIPELGSEDTDDVELPPIAHSARAAAPIEAADEGIEIEMGDEYEDSDQDLAIGLDSDSAHGLDAYVTSGVSDTPDTFDMPESSEKGYDDSKRIADLSPMMEQRIQETLEKVAWEAFSDLSEQIVKQVLGRVEKVAWEVIPEMAETLVREEIRKMKGEND